MWLAGGSPPSFLLTQDPEASVSGFLLLMMSLENCYMGKIKNP